MGEGEFGCLKKSSPFYALQNKFGGDVPIASGSTCDSAIAVSQFFKFQVFNGA